MENNESKLCFVYKYTIISEHTIQTCLEHSLLHTNTNCILTDNKVQIPASQISVVRFTVYCNQG